MRIPFRQWRNQGIIRRGLYWSILEGAVVGTMFVCLEAWLVPLLQGRLHASTWIIGFVSLIPQIGVIGLSPMTGRIVSALGGAKRACITSAWWQIILIALLSVPLHAAGSAWAIPVAVTLICLFGLTGIVNGPAWVAWMGALLPPSISGRYQANRARIFHVLKLIFAGVFALTIHYLPVELGPWGLQIVLLTAVISRLLSVHCLEQQPDAPQRLRQKNQPPSLRSLEAAVGMWGFIRTMQRTDIGRWTLAWATFQGGCAVVGPFFASYMISAKEEGGLALDPWSYSLLLYTSAISRIVFLPFVGRLVDLYKPRSALRFSFILILFIPVAWAVTDSIPLLVVNEILSGFAWAIAECAIGSLLFACHGDPARRAELIGYFNTVTAIMVAIGIILSTSFIGVFTEIVKNPSVRGFLPMYLQNPFHMVMLLSVLLRIPGLILALRWLPRLRPLTESERGTLFSAMPGAAVAGGLGKGLKLFRLP
ncbi:MAG: MFS transporter [Planctomycetota bacterium]